MSTMTLTAPALTTVTAANLRPGDLIGGTAGEWMRVESAWTDPNVKHKVTEVDVAPVDQPDRKRTWLIDAAARVAILRPEGGTS